MRNNENSLIQFLIPNYFLILINKVYFNKVFYFYVYFITRL
jgi:hypothetical protein